MDGAGASGSGDFEISQHMADGAAGGAEGVGHIEAKHAFLMVRKMANFSRLILPLIY